MSDGIYSALSGAIAQQRSLDVVANNVANVSTDGFRGDRVAFREALAQTGGGATPNALRYVVVSQVQTDASAGSLRSTGRPFDLALQGDGLFAVDTPAGERFTRAGSFTLDGDGVLRTDEGHPVLADSGVGGTGQTVGITVPRNAGAVLISPDGTVTADGNQLGRIRIVEFEEPDVLVKQGHTLFSATAAPIAAANTQVMQGYLESSNVNAVAGLNELISVTRSFEAFQKVIQTFRQLDERTARDLGART